MIIKLLIYIKHHMSFIWTLVEWCNSILFNLLYGRKLRKILPGLLEEVSFGDFVYKLLTMDDITFLAEFFASQPAEAYKFFNPHGLDEHSLRKRKKDKAFVMIGTFCGSKLVGYCFLRCFFNKQAFRGKIVDQNYQGKGIAKQMGVLTTNICSALGLRLYATISKKNVKSLASSKAVNEVRIIKELEDDYLYVEYLLKNRT